MKKYGLCLVFVLIYLFSAAQQKYERETGINSSQAPDTAVSYMEKLFGTDARVRWYREESLQGITVEAKTKLAEGIYSVKFDTTGRLIDIELTQREKEVPYKVMEQIVSHLASAYDRYRIRKIQVQWTGAPETLYQLITGKSVEGRYTVRYEIEHSGRIRRDSKPYESLFDSEGKHIETKEIIPRSINHLIY